jgi:hypothetical protein
MAGSVKPVVAEILSQEDRRPAQHRARRDLEHAVVRVQIEIPGRDQPLEEYVEKLLGDAAAQVVDRIVQRYSSFLCQTLKAASIPMNRKKNGIASAM